MRIRIWRPRRDREEGQQEARAALVRAQTDLQQARDRGDEVDRAVAKLRALRERNHFAEMIYRALQGGGG